MRERFKWGRKTPNGFIQAHARGGNFLVLDEPTNHLDLEAIIALGEALFKFDGALICVSHDRELIDAYANRIIELVPSPKGASIIDFKGSYEEYLASKK